MNHLITCFMENGIRCQSNVPLSCHTTFGIGGNASLMVFPKTKTEAVFAAQRVADANLPLYVLGQGSNLLVCDEGVRGVVINTLYLSALSFDDTTVTAEAGVRLADLLYACARRGLGGMENLYGIPASVGGGVRMNCGAFDATMAQRLLSVMAVHLQSGIIHCFDKDECLFGYRESRFQSEPYMILEAKYELSPTKAKDSLSLMRAVQSKRQRKQPYTQKSAGSVFRRPPSGYAATMIEDVGLKGFSVGDACVSEKHAGFIVNRNRATAKDVLDLIDVIKTKVYQKHGVTLCCEIEIWGRE